MCGEKIFKERRNAMLHQYSLLGMSLPMDQRINFKRFAEEWDHQCVQAYGNAWPDLFLSKLKGVIDKAETDRWAFSKFMYDEEHAVFRGTNALLVPGRPCITRTFANCV